MEDTIYCYELDLCKNKILTFFIKYLGIGKLINLLLECTLVGY